MRKQRAHFIFLTMVKQVTESNIQQGDVPHLYQLYGNLQTNVTIPSLKSNCVLVACHHKDDSNIPPDHQTISTPEISGLWPGFTLRTCSSGSSFCVPHPLLGVFRSCWSRRCSGLFPKSKSRFCFRAAVLQRYNSSENKVTVPSSTKPAFLYLNPSLDSHLHILSLFLSSRHFCLSIFYPPGLSSHPLLSV